MTEPRPQPTAKSQSVAGPTNPAMAPIVIMMGVAGSGKTQIGRAVASRLGWSFVDADDVHPASNVAKMRAGHALTGADREPWLETLNRLLRTRQSEGVAVVLACSALKHAYRRTLVDGVTNQRVVHLDVPQPVIVERVSNRRGHFLPSELVASQFAELEVPGADEAIIIDADRPKAEVIDSVIDALHRWFDMPQGLE